MLVVFFKVSSLKLVMVSPLLLSRGLRKEENNEKKRKRAKRNEIQCMILFKSLVFVFNQPKKCFEKGYSSNDSIDYANNVYIKNWGEDKIFKINK